MTRCQQLLELMEQNAGLYEELGRATMEEREIVASGRLDGLVEAVKAKETILLKVRMIEDARVSLLGKIAEDLGRDPEKLTLGELAELPENRGIRRKLLEIRDRLSGIIEHIKEINNFNRALIGKAIGNVTDSFRHLERLTGSGSASTYSSGRVVAASSSKGRMVRRAL